MPRGVAQQVVLSDEFEIENAAPHMLEAPPVLSPAFVVDPLPHGGDVGEQRIGIAWRAEDRPNPVHHRRAELTVAGHRPRPRERHVLPGPGVLFMVAAEGGGFGGNRPRAARGAQPGIDLVESTLGGVRAESIRQALAEACVVVARRKPLGTVGLHIHPALGAIDEDHVEVAVEGHLAAAELAQAEDREGRAPYRAVPPREFLLHPGQQRRDYRIGDVRQSAGQPIRGHIAPEDLHPDLELAHMLPTPHPIEHGLKFVGRREGSV